MTLRAHDAAGTRGGFRLDLEERPIEPGDERSVRARRAFSQGLSLWDDYLPDSGERARAKLEEAAGLWRRAGDRRGEIDARNEIGNVLLVGGWAPQAFRELDRALPLARQIGYRAGEAKALSYLAVANLFLDRAGVTPDQRVAMAREELRDALAIWDALGEVAEQGEVMLSLGYSYYVTAPPDYATAERWYERSLALRRQIRDVEGEANTLDGIGVMREARGEFEAAKSYLSRALVLSRRLRDPRLAMQLLVNLGTVYHKGGEPEKALACYTDPLLSRPAILPQTRALNLYSLASLYFEVGELDQAFATYQQVVETRAAKDYRLLALIGMGRVLAARGDFDGAVGPYRRALDESRLEHSASEAVALDGLGSLYFAKHQARTALGYLVPARERYHRDGNRSGEAQVLVEIGKAQEELGENEAADQALAEAIAAAEAGKRQSILVSCLAARASFDLARGELVEARRVIERAIAEFEAERSEVTANDLRVSLFSVDRSLYDIQVGVLMQLDRAHPRQGFDRLALVASEQARARGLLDLIAERAAPPGARGSFLHPEPLRDVAEIQALLGSRTAFLEYSLGTRASYLFVLTRQRLATYTLPPAPELERRVARLRRALESPNGALLASYRREAATLYRWLLPPGAAAQPDLLIAPDGILHLLPFEALLSSEAAADTPLQRLPYLVTEHAIAYVPSASVLRSLRQRPETSVVKAGGRSPKRFLAFANTGAVESGAGPASEGTEAAGSVGAAPQAKALPGAKIEVETIARLFSPDARAVFIDSAADRRSVVGNPFLQTARWVHFAMHAVVDEEHPQRSRLVLSPQRSGEDGVLSVEDILKLRLSADLVVLSACETGLGKRVTGEGMIGLTRAFLYAGARSLVVSLWLASDSSTPQLMRDFYEGMESGQSKGEALRRAQVAMIASRRYAHPFYWAPFVLEGDPR